MDEEAGRVGGGITRGKGRRKREVDNGGGGHQKEEVKKRDARTHGEGQDGGEEGSLVIARQFGQDAVQNGGELQGRRRKVNAGHRSRKNKIRIAVKKKHEHIKDKFIVKKYIIYS